MIPEPERPCEVCGKMFSPLIDNLRKGKGKTCSRACGAFKSAQIHKLKCAAVPIEDRFYNFVDKSSGPDGCWLWNGTRNPKGYGAFKINGTMVPAHKMAASLKFGFDVHDDWVGCHKCDNPPCVNPDHIFKGTVFDNIRDRNEKGRQATGEKIWASKLNDDKVRAIRLDERSYAEIAKDYGVKSQAIYLVKVGKRWTHVD